MKQVDTDGAFTYSSTVEARITLSSVYELSEAYPNPFREQTQVTLRVAEAQNVSVRVYDVLGRRVAQLHEGTIPAQELHRFTLQRAGLNGGLYFVRVIGETFRITRSAVLIR